MYKVKFISVAVMLATATTAMAGGILTNTNQSVEFLKNPARDAAIGLDGVYSNPAGVVFMPEGFHLAINWQYAHQTRTVRSTNPLFALGRKTTARQARPLKVLPMHPLSPLSRQPTTQVTGAFSSTSPSQAEVAYASLRKVWDLSKVPWA